MSFSHIRAIFLLGSALTIASAITGCSSRDVEVSGETKAAQGAALKGAIKLQFFELSDDKLGDSVHEITQTTPGAFKEKFSVSSDIVRVIAINDVDGDGKCSSGEAWGQADATIKDDDTVDPVAITLTNDACP